MGQQGTRFAGANPPVPSASLDPEIGLPADATERHLAVDTHTGVRGDPSASSTACNTHHRDCAAH